MDKKNKLSTTWSQIAEECLKLPESQWRGIQTNVTDTLRAMGWKRKQVRIEGSSYAKEWRWYPPDGWVDRYQEEQPDAGRQSRETEQPRNPPNEPDDDLELMLGKGHYASAVNGKAPCRQCNATAGVSLVDGLCGQCRIRQSAQPS